VTSSPIAPVIPPSPRGPADRRQGERLARRLPLAPPPPDISLVCDVVYGLARIDASGRIADRAVTAALGWQAGDRLTLTAESGMVVARRDPGGMITLQSRPYVAIPAALRRRCGLRARDRVVVAAWLTEDALAAYPLALIDQALRAHGAVPAVAGGTR
jgi:hypothetical protein